MNKKGVLFVDDEPNILSGIKRMLRSLRNEYDFNFAESGKAALEIIEENSIDIVISDMRMPGMDGAEFLKAVKEHHPQIIRIMLTGQADEESVFRTVNVVHQFLSKPCEPELLKEILGRSSDLHDRLNNTELKKIISGIDHLPSLPDVYANLQKILKKEDTTADDIAKVIEKDIGMTAKLLQLVNSSFFGLYQKVESPARAVNLLGFDTIRILVLGVQIFSELKTNSSPISLSFLKDHSMMVGQCSKKIALASVDDPELINECFLAGMLHDIGRLLLLANCAESYLPLVEKAKNEGTLLVDEETQQLKATHGDVGTYLIGLWGFSGNILEAISYHHNISAYPRETFSPALAVHVADALYYKFYPQHLIGAPPEVDLEYLEKTGFGAKLAKWEEICATVLEDGEDEI
ncbi:MAG: response regulator [Desulfocapsaceae bacterium]|nr:response regulator [Desulfocapsaceae bacterium]